MTLAALIRKRAPVPLATATPATPATLETEKGRTVATVATVAVANPTEAETDTPARWWLLHYPDREPVECFRSPLASWGEMLADNPDAMAAIPINDQGEALKGTDDANP